MKFFKPAFVILLVAVFIVACKPGTKIMTPEDFIKIENEVLSTDQTPEATEEIAKKFGFTLEQYNNFKDQIEKDPELKKKMGEITLDMQKK